MIIYDVCVMQTKYMIQRSMYATNMKQCLKWNFYAPWGWFFQ